MRVDGFDPDEASIALATSHAADERTEDVFTVPASEVERVLYGYSVMCFLPSSMDEQPSAATGTVMRRSTFEAYARDAGFAQVTVLPIEHDLLRFYRLDPQEAVEITS